MHTQHRGCVQLQPRNRRLLPFPKRDARHGAEKR
nr:MAG TPA: hypothetical protein [Caudoviricetes sp.]